MITSSQGINIITHYESLHDGDLTMIGVQPKKDPIGIVTWGYGHTETIGGRQIKSFDVAKKLFPEMETMTISEAEELLLEDLVKEEAKVKLRINIPITQYEFDALVSYFFNIGYSATMVQLVNQKASASDITKWMTGHYITADGVFMKGLLYRRQSEALLFTTGELKFFN